MQRGIRAAGLAALTALTIVVTPAFANDVPKARSTDAATHFRRAVELYDEADFSTALVEFRRAYEIAPNFHVLYNIAQAHYQLQQYAPALHSFRKYLNDGGANIPSARRAEVEREVTRLEGRVARVRVSGEPGIELFVDGEATGTTPLGEPLIVSAGRHIVRAVAPGKTAFVRTIELAGGDDVMLPIVLGEAPKDPGQADAPRSSSTPIVVGWLATGALAAAAVGTGIAALSAESKLDDEKRKSPGNVTARGLADAADRASTFALLTDVFGGAAIVAGGISLYLTLRPKSDRAVAIAPNGLQGIVVRARF